jgi:pyruvate kinase
VRSKQIREVSELDELILLVDSMLREYKWVLPGDLIVLVAGTPLTVGGHTDLIKLHRIGS